MGPKHVHFVVVAGSREELADNKKNIEYYGDDALDWRPYHPVQTENNTMGDILVTVAGSKKFLPHFYYDFPHLLEFLDEANRRRNVVIVIVDIWTIGLKHYKKILGEYDKKSLMNCVSALSFRNGIKYLCSPGASKSQSIASTFFPLLAKIQAIFAKVIERPVPPL